MSKNKNLQILNEVAQTAYDTANNQIDYADIFVDDYLVDGVNLYRVCSIYDTSKNVVINTNDNTTNILGYVQITTPFKYFSWEETNDLNYEENKNYGTESPTSIEAGERFLIAKDALQKDVIYVLGDIKVHKSLLVITGFYEIENKVEGDYPHQYKITYATLNDYALGKESTIVFADPITGSTSNNRIISSIKRDDGVFITDNKVVTNVDNLINLTNPNLFYEGINVGTVPQLKILYDKLGILYRTNDNVAFFQIIIGNFVISQDKQTNNITLEINNSNNSPATIHGRYINNNNKWYDLITLQEVQTTSHSYNVDIYTITLPDGTKVHRISSFTNESGIDKTEYLKNGAIVAESTLTMLEKYAYNGWKWDLTNNWAITTNQNGIVGHDSTGREWVIGSKNGTEISHIVAYKTEVVIFSKLKIQNNNANTLISRMLVDGEQIAFNNYLPLKIHPSIIRNNRVEVTNDFGATDRVLNYPAIKNAVAMANGMTTADIITALSNQLDEQLSAPMITAIDELIQKALFLGALVDSGFRQFVESNNNHKVILAPWKDQIANKKYSEAADAIDKVIFREFNLWSIGEKQDMNFDSSGFGVVSANFGTTYSNKQIESMIKITKIFFAMGSTNFVSSLSFEYGGVTAQSHLAMLPWSFKHRIIDLSPMWNNLVSGNHTNFNVGLIFPNNLYKWIIDSKYFKSSEINYANTFTQTEYYGAKLLGNSFVADQEPLWNMNSRVWMMISENSFGNIIEVVSGGSSFRYSDNDIANPLKFEDVSLTGKDGHKLWVNGNALPAGGKSNWVGGSTGTPQIQSAFINLLNNLSDATTLKLLNGGSIWIYIAPLVTWRAEDNYLISDGAGGGGNRYEFKLPQSMIQAYQRIAPNVVAGSLRLDFSNTKLIMRHHVYHYEWYLNADSEIYATLLASVTTTGASNIFAPLLSMKDKTLALNNQRISIVSLEDSISEESVSGLPSETQQTLVNKWYVWIDGSFANSSNIGKISINENFTSSDFINNWPEFEIKAIQPREIDINFLYATQVQIILNGVSLNLGDEILTCGDETDDTITNHRFWLA